VATKVTTAGQMIVGGPFSLTDVEGVRRSDKDFAGKYTLIYFGIQPDPFQLYPFIVAKLVIDRNKIGFTHCPDICPTELIKMGKALDALGNFHIDLAPFDSFNC
jgi:protein SCO1/2